MRERFEVVRCGDPIDSYYKIRDNEHGKWNLPEWATTLNFGKLSRADDVCKLLNREWQMFLRNPS